MNFIHEDREFEQLVQVVARENGIAAALIEKDYWVTHTLWAIDRTGLDIWFKGGTSLSKGFGIIKRFSEDLDLMIQKGSVSGLPDVTNWTSTNKGPVAKRRAFYDTLAEELEVPGVRIERDLARDMLEKKDIAALPDPRESAFVLDAPVKREALVRAYEEIAPMYWGARIPLDEACSVIREWSGDWQASR